MEEPCGDFLADAGRAHDQYAAAGTGDSLQRRADAVDRARIAGQIGVAADRSAKARDFLTQPLGFGRARDHQEEPLGVERLFDEIDRPATDRGDRGVDITVTRYN